MRYYLSERSVLRWLEMPCVYDRVNDELYELDERAFEFLRECASARGGDPRAADRDFLDYCLGEGLLTGELPRHAVPPLIKSPEPSLRYLELQITNRCNLKCRHCYLGKTRGRELTAGQIRTALVQFEEMQGLRLLISGGEPLMHSGFDEIVAQLPAYRFRKVLFTNGLLLDRTRIDSLNVDEIQFSVDGLEEGHEILRGRGTYRMVMRSLEDALSAGVAVSVATMVHRGNMSDFNEMELLFRGLGIRDWTVDVPCVSGNLSDNPLLQVSSDVAGPFLRYGFGEGLHGGGEGYACGLHLMAVLADGKAAKCSFFAPSPVGSLHEGLRACWARVRPMPLSQLRCADVSCPALDSCRGGCRYRAGLMDGEAGGSLSTARDYCKCYEYDIIREA
jgi:radical SAM protein with 4Fe4S-binding SPASM domain